MIITDKIALLNQTTLESLNETGKSQIIGRFTETGIKILDGDFGFAYWKQDTDESFSLAYKSPNMTFEPRLPRADGHTSMVEKTKIPYLALVQKEQNPEYDLSTHMESIAIVPVFYKEHQYGYIIICFKQEKNFSEEDKSLCIALGNAAAQAITIHRLLKSETEARKQSENLQARFRALIENSYDIIALVSSRGEILYISPAATRVLGYELEALMGKNISEFIYEKDIALVNFSNEENLKKLETSQTIELRYKHNNGSWRWLEATGVNMLANPSVSSIVVNIRDITERKLSEETILHQALHDPLTNLPNRKEFVIRLNQALEAGKRHRRMLALMFLDIDRFKNINDTLGHAVGDTLLKVVASRFTSCLRAEDTVARFGGDEFLILLNEIHSSQEAVMVAEKILKAVAIPLQIGEHTFHLSVSIGIAVYPQDGEDVENLKKHADIAMYRAKANGRNCYSLYDPAKDSYAAEKFVLENELRQAIFSREIVAYYQPIINLKDNKLVSVEALARWRHPTRGLLLPGDFLPLAEERGLILSLTDYVLNMACRQHQIWQKTRMGRFRIAVNLPAQKFSENGFVEQIAELLEKYNMEPGDLELEITESIAMDNLELTTFNLKQLKKTGVHISIDDFGTGYSSLSYLKRFPINNLKIDRSFVRQCIVNEQDAGITRTIIAMAHSLNLKVIAEGVETDQQLNFLASLGCNAAQGFFISPPLPAEELAAWVAERSPNKKVLAV